MTKLARKRVKPASQILPRTPISVPSEEGAVDISTWRIFQPTISKTRCTKCAICWLYCPEGAIKLAPNYAPEIELSHCKGCGICAKECPLKAITMKFKGEMKDTTKTGGKW